MTRDPYSQAKALFIAARELAEERRVPFIESQTDDRAVREAVLSLLSHDDAAPTSADRGVSIGDPEGFIGAEIDGFRLLSVLGIGGMGVVYLAEQDRPRRRVALKLISRQFPREEHIRRFLYEVEVLGRLDHPGVATIHAAGVWRRESTRAPYFVMEHVPDAVGLTRFATEHGLSTRERVQLFTRVCDAVAHGHQRGIVHRDLKPDNVLVGADGAPKIIDFGIARSLDADLGITRSVTVEGTLVGTLQYMSPEQCDGPTSAIDTRSDVYALGIMLHELICGAPPYDLSGASVVAAARTISRGVGAVSAANRRSLGRTLEHIVLRCLEPRPAQRYGSAGELATDLRRYLDGDPVGRRGAMQRVARWLVRHPIATGAAGSAAAVLAASGVVALVLTYRVMLHPAYVEPSPDGSSVSVVSRGGLSLKRIDARLVGGIRQHERIFPGDGSESGWLLAVILHQDADHKHRGRLLIVDPFDGFAMADPTPITAEGFGIKATAQTVGVEYYARRLIVADVFPEADGPEIVVAFHHALNYPRVLQVRSQRGEVLFQCRIPGTVRAMMWHEGAGHLVCTGDLYGEAFALSAPCVYAVSPAFGVVSTDWAAPEAPATDPIGMSWCLRASAPSGVEFEPAGVIDPPGVDEVRLVSAAFKVAGTDAGIGFIIDARTGEVVDRVPNDVFRRLGREIREPASNVELLDVSRLSPR